MGSAVRGRRSARRRSPAATTRPTPSTATASGTWCRARKPIDQGERGLEGHQRAEGRRGQPAQREQLEGERHDRQQHGQPEAGEQQLRGQAADHSGSGHDRRDERGDRHRDREPAEAADRVAHASGSAGCTPPSRRRRRARRPRRPGRRPPVQGWVRQSTPTAATQRPGASPPAAAATATPSGPRNSSALAVPSGRRVTAAMNSRVTPAVTTPSAPPARSASRRERRRPRPHQHEQQHPGPEQPQPRGALGADLVDQADRGGRPSWTQSMDTTAIEAPVRAGARTWAQ